jgi:hypothetical protein
MVQSLPEYKAHDDPDISPRHTRKEYAEARGMGGKIRVSRAGPMNGFAIPSLITHLPAATPRNVDL